MGAKKIKANTTIVTHPSDEIDLDDIRIAPELLQTRAKLSRLYASEYARKLLEDGTPFPAVLVFVIAGISWLADGFHRVEAARKLGLTRIRAVFREGTIEDAILAGLKANFNPFNEQKVEPDDRKHAVEMMIRNEEFRTWSDKEISRRCGISHPLVRSIRSSLRVREGISFPPRVKRFNKDGVWIGKWSKYRHDRSVARIPSISPRSGRPGVRFIWEGERFTASTEEEAKRSIGNMESAKSSSMRAMARAQSFVKWLETEDIQGNMPERQCGFPGVVSLSSAVLVLVPDPSEIGISSAIGRATILASEQDGHVPILIVGYFGSVSTQASKTVIRAKAKLPFEFISPEKVVERFKPEDEDKDDIG